MTRPGLNLQTKPQRFLASCYWGQRGEEAGQVAERLGAFFDLIDQQAGAATQWTWPQRRPQRRSVPLRRTPDGLLEMVESSVRMNDLTRPHTPMPTHGYSTSMTGASGGQRLELAITIGNGAGRVEPHNMIALSTSSRRFESFWMYQPEKATALIRGLIDVFEPDRGSYTDHDTIDELERMHGRVRTGYLTYQRGLRGITHVPINDVTAEAFADGTLFTLGEHPVLIDPHRAATLKAWIEDRLTETTEG